MNADNPLPDSELLFDLLAERACRRLTPAEEAQLEHLLAAHPDVDRDEIDRLAAAVELSLSAAEFDPLPESLRQKILIQAKAFEPEHQPHAVAAATMVSIAPQPLATASWWPWLITAASVLLALTAWMPRGIPQPNYAAQRAELLTSKNLVRVPLSEPANGEEMGDIIWSPKAQSGYLRIKGLPVNNPAQTQYQLWIFDKNQDERYPIDGGVFNIDSASGDVIVPIHAALRVTDPVLFAVTAEKPGGVVVSSREQIKLIAKVGG
jgi:Anti-sigma-K factor rskA